MIVIGLHSHMTGAMKGGMKQEGKEKKKEKREMIVIMTKSRPPPGTIEMTESLVMEEIGGTLETPEIGGNHGNPETLETPETREIIAGIPKTVVTRETRAPHETPTTTETERVVMPIKRMTSIKMTCAAMEDRMAERRALVLKQGMTPGVTPEMRAEVIELAEVEAEVQNYLTKEVGGLEDPRLMVTAVVETTMTAGNQGVATLIGIAMTVGIKHGIPPLKEDMVNGIGVTTEKEIREQAHRYGTKDGVMISSGMKGEKSEGWIGLMTGEMKGPGRESGKGRGTEREREKEKETGKERGRKKESWSEIVLENGRGTESGTKTGTVSGTETETMTGKGNERGRGRRRGSESGRSAKGSENEREIGSGSVKGREVETETKSETARETGMTKKKEGKTAGIREKIFEKKEAQEMSMRKENPRSVTETKAVRVPVSHPNVAVIILLIVMLTTAEMIKMKSTDS